MVYVQWQASMETGVAAVDTDHKLLVSLLNQVHDCIDSNEEYATLGSVLSALSDYAEYHFHREEILMEQAGYTGLIGHKALHGKFTAHLSAVNRRYRDQNGGVRAVDILTFLERWLVDHILHQDMAFRETVLKLDVPAEGAGSSGPAQTGSFSLPLQRDFIGGQNLDWKGLRVLVVDDNAHFLTLMQTILNGIGIKHVTTARSAGQGLDLLSRRAFDVVISDWHMEEMNGLDFVREIRAAVDPQWSKLAIIMISGRSTADVRQTLQDLGIAAFIEKPISARDMMTTLARIAGLNKDASLAAD